MKWQERQFCAAVNCIKRCMWQVPLAFCSMAELPTNAENLCQAPRGSAASQLWDVRSTRWERMRQPRPTAYGAACSWLLSKMDRTSLRRGFGCRHIPHIDPLHVLSRTTLVREHFDCQAAEGFPDILTRRAACEKDLDATRACKL